MFTGKGIKPVMATKVLIKLNYRDQAQSATADSLLTLVTVLWKEKWHFIYSPAEKVVG